jgi:Protein of unknown function (DUF1700)
MTDEAQVKIEAYLSRVRGRLRGLGVEEKREILEELRSHIMDKAASSGEQRGAAVEAALTSLGSPEELAREYVTDELLARAEVSRSPWQLLDGLFRWASISLAGFYVLSGSIVGYFMGTAFILVAALKPFHPETAGLWLSRDATGERAFSLRMGFGTVPAGMREVLGWWIVPIGLLVGCGLLIGTTRVALWCARQYRKSRAI